MRSRVVGQIVVVCGLGGLLAWGVSVIRKAEARADSQAQRAEQVASELAAVQAKVARLGAATLGSNARLRNVEERSRVQPEPPISPENRQPPLGDADDSLAEGDDVSPVAAAEAKQAASIERVTQGLDRRLDSEPSDYAWSRNALASAREVVGGVSGARVGDTKCGTNLCRMEVEQSEADTQPALATTISSVPPFASGTIYKYASAEGRKKTTLYFVRDGRNFQELLREP